VAFSALRAAPTAAPLMTRFSVQYELSLDSFRRAIALASSHRTPRTASVLGDPSPDSAIRPRLPRLPGAAREARAVASLYGSSGPLVGDAATVPALLRALLHADVLHFAGHAIVDPMRPELSFLALAPVGQASPATLTAREIGALRLSNLRVVVLSACSTLGARATRGGPGTGLAFGFLRAGVPATLSTLWELDDASAEPVVTAFHRRLREGIAPAEALRQAQSEAARSSDPAIRHPRSWAAFVLVGA
jgi:CHAT domain-containing protein